RSRQTSRPGCLQPSRTTGTVRSEGCFTQPKYKAIRWRSCMAETLTATLQTNQGRIVIRLFPDQAPKTVRNFVELAEGGKQWTDPSTGQVTTSKLYDGTIFHRVIPDLMSRAGDPPATGRGGSGRGDHPGPPEQGEQTAAQVPTRYRHPGRETYVSCVRCGRHACPDCLRSAAVGQQCVDCVKGGNRNVRQATGQFG